MLLLLVLHASYELQPIFHMLKTGTVLASGYMVMDGFFSVAVEAKLHNEVLRHDSVCDNRNNTYLNTLSSDVTTSGRFTTTCASVF